MAALAMNLPMVIMKKQASSILKEGVLQTEVFSFTKNSSYQLTLKKHFIQPGDRVLLCSDGLFKTLSLQEINSIIASSQGCSAQDELLRAVLAKDKRKQDNVTLVMLYCDPV